jgi:hypothetical protein
MKKTFELTGFKLVWEWKEIEKFYDIEYGEPLLNRCFDFDGVSNDQEASEKLFRIYPHWKYCLKSLYVFDDETGMWSDDVAVHEK